MTETSLPKARCPLHGCCLNFTFRSCRNPHSSQFLCSYFLALRKSITMRKEAYESRLRRFSVSVDSLSLFQFSLPKSLTCPQNSLKVGQTDIADRPRFDNGSDALSTPSSTPETQSSWPPRPASTVLRPTCVADHVVSYPACSPSTPLRNHLLTPVVTSPQPL